MNGNWTQFGGNLSFVCLAISLWALFSIQFQRRAFGQEKIAFGIVAGGASIGSILLAVEFHPGIYIDLRFSPLVLAGMFGGPIAAAFAAAMAIVFRFAVGGTAMVDGIITMAVATGVGLAGHAWTRKRSPGLKDVALLSLALGFALVLSMTMLPTLVNADVLAGVGFPLTALNCLATVLGGFVLLKTQQWELERSILVTAFSQSPDYLYVKDRNSRFITVNENMTRLFRFRTTAEMIGLSDFNLMSRPLAEELYHLEQQVIDTGVPLIDSTECIEGRFLLASKVPLRDKQGRVIGLAGVTRDVTERTALERELRESKNLLSHAMAGMSDGIAMYDSRGFILFCNDQYRTAFPLSERPAWSAPISATSCAASPKPVSGPVFRRMWRSGSRPPLLHCTATRTKRFSFITATGAASGQGLRKTVRQWLWSPTSRQRSRQKLRSGYRRSS